MSSIFAANDSPFNQIVFDEATDLRALSNALQLAEGFTLLFARCNQPDQRRRLVAILRERLPHLNIQEIELREPIPHLLDELRYEIAEPVPDVIFVSGLEYSLPVAAQAANTPFVLNLNASRNSFSRYIPCPLVLWTPEYALTAIMNGAPDFFSVRSGVYFFALSNQQGSTFARSLVGGAEWQAINLPSEEKSQRIQDIKSLLADYRIQSQSQRDFAVEARLLSRLGNLQLMLGQLSEAQASYKELLALSERTENIVGQASVLGFLANVYQKQGQTERAEQSYQHSLELLAQADKSEFTTSILNNYALLLTDQGRLEESEKLYLQALHNSQAVHDKVGEAGVLSNLGGVYARQDRWKDAADAFVHSGVISTDLHNLSGMQQAMHNLGNVCKREGKWNEANEYFTRSLEIAHELGDRDNEWRTLRSLAILHRDSGDFSNAIKFAQQSIDVLESMEISPDLNIAYKLLSDLRQHQTSSST